MAARSSSSADGGGLRYGLVLCENKCCGLTHRKGRRLHPLQRRGQGQGPQPACRQGWSQGQQVAMLVIRWGTPPQEPVPGRSPCLPWAWNTFSYERASLLFGKDPNNSTSSCRRHTSELHWGSCSPRTPSIEEDSGLELWPCRWCLSKNRETLSCPQKQTSEAGHGTSVTEKPTCALDAPNLA